MAAPQPPPNAKEDQKMDEGAEPQTFFDRLFDPLSLERRLVSKICPAAGREGADPTQCPVAGEEARRAQHSKRPPPMAAVLLNWALALLLGWLLWPLIDQPTPVGPLEHIERWAMRGHGREIPSPLVGCFVLQGLNPMLLLDTSHARSWDAATRSFVLDMGGPGVYAFESATAAHFTGEHASTAPSTPMSGLALLQMYRVLRYAIKLTISEDGTRASVAPSFFFERSPLGLLSELLVRQELEQHPSQSPLARLHRLFGARQSDTSWKLTNFKPPSNATADAHYWMRPVLTRRRDGSLEVHSSGLALAQRKLAMSNGSRLVHFPA